jgi:hypothetical protein
MSTEQAIIGEAKSSPTKLFFVTMLTRDIELQDALLDLLDNCVDGILRSGKAKQGDPKPYAGFRATVELSKSGFIIEDNCGGIPFEIAEKYAFAMGRPPGIEDANGEGKVGMYGIGMKRAIFKMGSEARIESRNDRGFVVDITSEWMQDDKWADLPMFELDDSEIPAGGTKVIVKTLHPDIAASFGDADWIDDFRKAVARHYAIIIDKGFEVTIGSPDELAADIGPVPSERFRLLASKSEDGGSLIEPYVYKGTLHGVSIEIYGGLYRQLLNAEELEDEDETRGSTDDAGWTVACNDRIVIWKDRSKLTGWGEGTVPNYHGQFIAITGLVLLSASDPRKLPLTTTKRGIDGASNVYLDAKDLMREATKALTSFTNKWKKFPAQLETLYKESEYVDLAALQTRAAEARMDVVRKYPDVRKIEPRLPSPPQEKTSTRVSFVAEKVDVDLLARKFFDDSKIKPGVVGEEAFRRAVVEAKK